jgi:cell division septum initiation protein DivIVA
MSIYEHAADVQDCKEELTAFIDRVLDNYPNNPEKSTVLLKQIVALQNDLEELEGQFEAYIKKNG